MDSEANKVQVGGNHYKADGKGEEHWDRVQRLGLDYFQAQITKYVERCWLKNGLQDLEKAQHFIQKYIEIHTRLGTVPVHIRGDFFDQRHGRPPLEFQMHRGTLDGVQVYGPMDHHTNAGFEFEGMKESDVHYRCKHCRAHFHIPINCAPPVSCPEPSCQTHKVKNTTAAAPDAADPAGPGPGYVNQG